MVVTLGSRFISSSDTPRAKAIIFMPSVHGPSNGCAVIASIAVGEVSAVTIEMPRIGRKLLRCGHLVPYHVDGVEVMRQPDEILVVVQVSRAPPIHLIMHIGRPRHETEHHIAIAEEQFPRRVARGECEAPTSTPR